MPDPDLFLFVSHVREDRQAALEIVAELEQRGVPCWIAPRNVHPGQPFDNQIAAAIETCRALLLVFSEQCNEHDYIRREVTVASDSHKVIIPFRIEDARPKHGLRVRLSDLHWIDGFISRERAIDQLVREIDPEQTRRQQEEERRLLEERERQRLEEEQRHKQEDALQPQQGTRIQEPDAPQPPTSLQPDTPPRMVPDALAEMPDPHTLTGHTDTVCSVAFSPDGRTLASGSRDQTIKLWDAASGEELRTLIGHSWVSSVAFSPDRRTLALASDDQTVKLWNIAALTQASR